MIQSALLIRLYVTTGATHNLHCQRKFSQVCVYIYVPTFSSLVTMTK